MTTVNVTLTPGTDADQSASAQAQMNAAPNGTLGNETIINMPAGRYRMDNKLILSNRSHIRWTCLAGVPVYPNFPTDSQAFVAYTDKTSESQGLSPFAGYLRINSSTNVVGSFLRIEGPNTFRRTDNPLYAGWSYGPYNDHGFGIHSAIDSGFEDCSWHNVHGDGLYIGGVNTRSVGCHAYRMTGDYAGRMNLALISCIDTTVIDYTGDWNGYAGLDIEPLGADEWVWDAYLENIHMGSYFYPYTFHGHGTVLQGNPVPVGKKNIHLKNCSVIRCASINHRSLWTQGDCEGYIIIDGLTDLRNRATIPIVVNGYWDDITIKNCRVRAYPNTATTYGFAAYARESITVTNNNFNGTTGGEGADVLGSLSQVYAPTYTHWGNVWAMGTQNDGAAPSGGVGAVTAAKPSVHGVGTATNLAVGNVTAAAPSVSGVGSASFVDETLPPTGAGGPPFRVRGSRPSRIRGVEGSTIRGQGGPPGRHAFRVRPETSISRLRSETGPSYLRAGEQGIPVTGTGAVTAAAPSVAGLGAAGGIVATGAVTAAAPSVSGTATETIPGTGAVTGAIPTAYGTGVVSDQTYGDVLAAAPSVAGIGSVSALGVGSVVAAAPSVSGVGVESIEGTGAVLAAKPSVAGVAFMPLMTGTGAVTAEAPSVAGVGSVTDIDISVVEVWYLPPVILGHRAPHYLRRFDQIGIPRSPKYRQFLRNYVDAGEVVGDTPEGDNIYGFVGGRWNGPLTQEQVDIITAAGQESRMITVHSINELPPDLESDYAGAVSEGGYGHDYGHDYGH